MKEKQIPICREQKVHQHEVEKAGEHLPTEEDLFSLAELFKVFGDSTRVRILSLLCDTELCVCDIAACLGMNLSAISHQLRVLKQAKLVKFRKEGKTVYYSLADAHVLHILAQGLDHVRE